MQLKLGHIQTTILQRLIEQGVVESSFISALYCENIAKKGYTPNHHKTDKTIMLFKEFDLVTVVKEDYKIKLYPKDKEKIKEILRQNGWNG